MVSHSCDQHQARTPRCTMAKNMQLTFSCSLTLHIKNGSIRKSMLPFPYRKACTEKPIATRPTLCASSVTENDLFRQTSSAGNNIFHALPSFTSVCRCAACLTNATLYRPALIAFALVPQLRVLDEMTWRVMQIIVAKVVLDNIFSELRESVIVLRKWVAK